MELSTRLIYRDWPKAARWTQNGNIWRFVVIPLSLSLFNFLRFPYSRHSSFFNSSNHPLHHTHVQSWTDWRDTGSKHQVQNDRQTLSWRNCLCSVLMSVRDGQRLGMLDGVSVTVKCLVSHIHGEVCRLGYWLTGHHVERSMTALLSSRSVRTVFASENPHAVHEVSLI